MSSVRRWFLPRPLHPGAWWLWALGLAVAASRTTNPVVLLLINAVVCLVVVARRPLAPWAMAFRLYLYVAAFVVFMRVAFRIIFNGNGPTVLFTLWEIRLPEWMAGIQLLGPVSAEALLAAAYDGLRLGTMIVCIGAANALANPKRLLAAVPGALYELGTVLVVSLSVFPQLAESVQRVFRARQLRAGATKGARGLKGIIVPVLTDALDRSLQLAAAMDSRGYGRATAVRSGVRRLTSFLLLLGMVALCVGVYAALDGSTEPWLSGTLLGVGAAVSVVALRLAGRRARRTRYRPDRWSGPEILVVASGAAAAVALFLVQEWDKSALHPSIYPILVPTLPVVAVVGILVALAPAFLTPVPDGETRHRTPTPGGSSRPAQIMTEQK